MTKIITVVETRALDDGKYVMLTIPFIFVSDVLKKYKYKNRVVVPTGFVFDFESVPIIRGTSKRAGLCHDYLYRIDSDPCVPRPIADKVYLEVMKYRGNAWWRRLIKYEAVKLLGKDSYHQFKVGASFEEINNKLTSRK